MSKRTPRFVGICAAGAEYEFPFGIGGIDERTSCRPRTSKATRIPKPVQLDPAKIGAAQAWADKMQATITKIRNNR